ncbi:MAG TPA: hypothetical protein VMU87_01050, partial [Stellaceae bacterium]|nr:hypothetical protein [Stellaceae bacterium]
HVEWRANFGVASASFTLVNGSNRWVSDLTLFCEFFAPSGTELGDVSPVLYQRVAPGRSLHVTGFTLGRIDPQVATARCNIIGFH